MHTYICIHIYAYIYTHTLLQYTYVMTNATHMLNVKYGAIQSGSSGTGSLSVPKFRVVYIWHVECLIPAVPCTNIINEIKFICHC